MRVSNVEVAFLERAKKTAGMPMSVGGNPIIPSRVKSMGGCKSGGGHDCFLKGIRVAFDVEAPHHEWMQIERYTFMDIVSSQSKMHRLKRLTNVNAEEMFPDVSDAGMNTLLAHINMFDEGLISKDVLMANVPCGMYLKAGMNSNYLALKTVFNQRKLHGLEGWRNFVQFCIDLPEFLDLTGCEPPKWWRDKNELV